MIGNAFPLRYSRRIKKRASLLPVRVSPKKKIRKPSVKKRISVVDSPLQRAKEKKVGVKYKLRKSPKSSPKASLQASCYLKPVTRKSLLISKPNVIGKKRKIRNSIKESPVKLTNKKVSSKNLDLFDNTKKVLEKKSKKFVKEEKQPTRRSLRLSKSSPSPSRKSDSDSKLSKSKSSQKKRENHVTSLNSELVFTLNSEKGKHTPKLPGIKKSTKFSEAQNQMVHVLRSASKSLAVTPVPVKVTQTTKQSRIKKSSMLLKEPNISNTKNSFYALLQTPQPEKHSEKRKSTRLLESKSSPLQTLNKELPMSTPVSLLTRNLDSTLKKSTTQCKSGKLSSSENRSRKRNRSKVSNKDDSCVSHEKRKRRHISEQQKTSENFKKPLSTKTENLLFDILTTPAFKPPCGRSSSKKYSLKSDSGSSKRKLNVLASENLVAGEEVLQANLQNRKSADFPKIPAKGTLKYKRWLLGNLKEKNGSYEDDIFENQNLDFYKPAFHFGDESDGSSVNMATPKFDCILTPALPKKTPRYKDCISPSEFLQARKTAEEYLFRRNKKRKSGDGPSSSGKKTSMNTKNKVQDIPEKKKLDFEEAVNKLIAVQKDLETEAEIGDEEEDSYFSDASN